MTDRVYVLFALLALGVVLLALFNLYRRRWTDVPDRLSIDELELALMEGCCAFVVFTSPSCRPCKAAIRVVSDAAKNGTGVTEVVTVDLTEKPELAIRYEVRTIPTVFLITASGHVVKRWRGVPEPEDAAMMLAAI